MKERRISLLTRPMRLCKPTSLCNQRPRCFRFFFLNKKGGKDSASCRKKWVLRAWFSGYNWQLDHIIKEDAYYLIEWGRRRSGWVFFLPDWWAAGSGVRTDRCAPDRCARRTRPKPSRAGRRRAPQPDWSRRLRLLRFLRLHRRHRLATVRRAWLDSKLSTGCLALNRIPASFRPLIKSK